MNLNVYINWLIIKNEKIYLYLFLYKQILYRSHFGSRILKAAFFYSKMGDQSRILQSKIQVDDLENELKLEQFALNEANRVLDFTRSRCFILEHRLANAIYCERVTMERANYSAECSDQIAKMLSAGEIVNQVVRTGLACTHSLYRTSMHANDNASERATQRIDNIEKELAVARSLQTTTTSVIDSICKRTKDIRDELVVAKNALSAMKYAAEENVDSSADIETFKIALHTAVSAAREVIAQGYENTDTGMVAPVSVTETMSSTFETITCDMGIDIAEHKVEGIVGEYETITDETAKSTATSSAQTSTRRNDTSTEKATLETEVDD
jgi:hypothetical protein